MLVYLLLIAAAFTVITVLTTRIMEEFLVRERIASQTRQVNSLSVRLVPPLLAYDSDTLYSMAVKDAGDLGGRILILDNNGTVMVDGYSQLNGTHLEYREVQDIITGQRDLSYGFHEIPDTTGQTGDSTKSTWMVYYTSAIINKAETIGVLLFSTPIQDVYEQVASIRGQLILISAIICVLSIVLSLFIAQLITKPIKEIMQAIMHLYRGEFDKRVKVSGRSEMARLAATFNMMSQRLASVDKMRNEFVSNASHELRTPLGSIKILVESLLYGGESSPEVQKEFLQDINNEIDRLGNLVTDLMTLVKIDGRVEVKMENVELAGLTERVVRNLYPLAEAKGVAMSADLPEELAVRGSESRLHQAISNLIDNAIKYTPEGGTVGVLLERTETSAKLTVSDTGMGIPAEDLPHIFDRFYRVDKARSRETGGTGLGLSITREIIKMHGGIIRVKSEEGKGSVFTVDLPLQHEAISMESVTT